MNLLVAIREFRFAGTTVKPNQRFFARPEMAKVLKTLGRAEDAPDIPQMADTVKAAVDKVGNVDNDELSTLREEYEVRFGKKPDGRWKAPRLRDEIAGLYQRRDMQAVLPGVSVIDDLRGQYRTKFGTDANRRWKEARLRKELGL